MVLPSTKSISCLKKPICTSLSKAIVPLLSISLESTFKSVDFPAPFLPMRPIRSPLFNLKVIPENKSVPIKETVKLCTFSMKCNKYYLNKSLKILYLQKYTNLYFICLKRGASYIVFLKADVQNATRENSSNFRSLTILVRLPKFSITVLIVT